MSKVKIPMFMPLAMEPSDLPKQAAQARTDCGNIARLETTAAASNRMEDVAFTSS